MGWLRGGQFPYPCQNLVYAEKRKEWFSLLKASLFYYETSCLSSMSYSDNYNRPCGWQDLISSISYRSCEFWDSILKKTIAAYYLVSVPIFQTDEIIYYWLSLGYLIASAENETVMIVSCHLFLIITSIQRLPSEVMLGWKNCPLKKL